MSAILESGSRQPEARVGLVKLDEAASRLGCHVETLRLKIRRGKLKAQRGPHGAYYISSRELPRLKPRRLARRSFDPKSLEWTWEALLQAMDQPELGLRVLVLIAAIRARPNLSRRLHRLLSVHRLRIAELTSAEIGDLIGVSSRHVRRLSRRGLEKALGIRRRPPHQGDDYEREDDEELLDEDEEENLVEVFLRKIDRARQTAARRVVEEMQGRLKAAGFVRHDRAWRPTDRFTPTGSRPPARIAKKLDHAMMTHLAAGGLSQEQIEAIQLVGIGLDELNELIVHGLPP